MQDALAALFDDGGAKLQAVEVHPEYDLVLVKIRLPDLPTAERLRLQERVFTDLGALQKDSGDGASGHVYVPVFS